MRLVLARCLPSTTSASHCTSSSPASVLQKHLSTLSALTKQSNSLTEFHYYAPAPQLTGFVTPSTSQAWIQKAPPIQLSEEFTIALPLIGTRTLETLNQDYIVLRILHRPRCQVHRPASTTQPRRNASCLTNLFIQDNKENLNTPPLDQ